MIFADWAAVCLVVKVDVVADTATCEYDGWLELPCSSASIDPECVGV